MNIQRDNRPWRKDLSDKDILDKTFDIYNLLSTNDHPILNQIKELAFQNYKVKAKFIYLGYNGQYLYCNGRTLVYRKNKFSPMEYAKDVKLIEGIEYKTGGSNQYPAVGFKDNWCILEFISDGLPIINSLNGWKIEIISMEKI